MRRRISSAHHHQTGPVRRCQQQATPGVGVYAMRMRWWMWLVASSTLHRRIVPVRTAPWWWSRCNRGEPEERGSSGRSRGNAPTAAVCHIEGVGSVEAATAQKHACDSALLGAIIDKHGKVLAFGRSRRLVSKAQRRALLIRDGMCRYPGCHQTRHFKAHHVVPWMLGGRTDLDNLVLLFQWHHTAVHEGGVTITRDSEMLMVGCS